MRRELALSDRLFAVQITVWMVVDSWPLIVTYYLSFLVFNHAPLIKVIRLIFCCTNLRFNRPWIVDL